MKYLIVVAHPDDEVLGAGVTDLRIDGSRELGRHGGGLHSCGGTESRIYGSLLLRNGLTEGRIQESTEMRGVGITEP